MSRLHRTREQWRALIAEFEHSDLSQKDFCEPRGINPAYFSQRRFELQSNAEDTGTGFALAVPQTSAAQQTLQLRVGRRARLDASLPRKEVVHDISDDEKTCECCGTDMHRMGEDVSEKLDFIPAKVQVIRHVRPKYSCRTCEQQGTESNIKQAPVAPSILPKSLATPSLLGQIITAKFQYGLPLYRQEAMFKQFGADISRQTMSRSLVAVSQKLEPLYQRMHDILVQQPVL